MTLDHLLTMIAQSASERYRLVLYAVRGDSDKKHALSSLTKSWRRTATISLSNAAADVPILVVTEQRQLDTKSPETSCMLEFQQYALPEVASGRLSTLVGPQIMLAKACR